MIQGLYASQLGKHSVPSLHWPRTIFGLLDSSRPCYPLATLSQREVKSMTAINVVHMRVKPGMEAEFVRLHNDFDFKSLIGARNLWLVRSGERAFIVVGEWDGLDALTAARPAMIASLDRLRPILEDLGGGRGVTEPWSGTVALHMGKVSLP
jgi:hypothetical protein